MSSERLFFPSIFLGIEFVTEVQNVTDQFFLYSRFTRILSSLTKIKRLDVPTFRFIIGRFLDSF